MPNKFISLVCNNFEMCNSLSVLKMERGGGSWIRV